MIHLTFTPRCKRALLQIGDSPVEIFSYQEIELALLWIKHQVRKYGLRAVRLEPRVRYEWVGDEDNVAYAQPVIYNGRVKRPPKIIKLFDEPKVYGLGAPMSKVTNKQQRYITWIDHYIQEYDASPTFEEIGEAFGVTRDAAYRTVIRICEAGHLLFSPQGKNRLQVVKQEQSA